MNIQAVLPRPIENELRDKQHKRRVGSLTRQPQNFTPTIETISQFNHTLKNLPDLLHDYYRLKASASSQIELDTVKQFPIEIGRLLRIPVENFQDAREVTWHFLQCTGA